MSLDPEIFSTLRVTPLTEAERNAALAKLLTPETCWQNYAPQKTALQHWQRSWVMGKSHQRLSRITESLGALEGIQIYLVPCPEPALD